MTVFKDPLALTIFDEVHNESEDRWITVGLAETGRLNVVVHTFEDRDDHAYIRVISARVATPREQRAYREGPST